MGSQVFQLEIKTKSLTPLPMKSMRELGTSEPYDLESWLASTGKRLFNREILWIARQDRPADGERSDLLGLDHDGNLLVAELKKGQLDENGVTQALAYAAEYAALKADDLAILFADASQKNTSTALVKKADSRDDATKQISTHCGESELNETQILLLIAEDFAPKALAICDYLNGASGDASFSLECWRYSVFEQPKLGHLFLLEQILPPPSVRKEIEAKREAFKSKKYLRDPVKMAFMRDMLDFIRINGGEVTADRNRGQSYGCQIQSKDWLSEHELQFVIGDRQAYLSIPSDLLADGVAAKHKLTSDNQPNGKQRMIFLDETSAAKFTADFGKRVIEVVRDFKEATAGSASTSP
jgi:hypothetical protein